jgi:hypothetical protein
MKLLPDYVPPDAARAALAAGVAPLVVLLVFVLVVARLMTIPAAFATLTTVTLWVAWELHLFQRRTDAYNRRYTAAHLDWRTSAALLALVDADGAHAPTRRFVHTYLAAGRRTLRDGQVHEL